MKVLGVDQSYTKCGLVLVNNTEILESELLSAKKDLSRFEQALQIASQICSFCVSNGPERIIIEGLGFASKGNVTRDLAGLQFVIVTNLIQHFLAQPFQTKYNGKIGIVAPKTLKVFATKNGNAEKQELYESLPDKAREHIDATGVKKTTGRYDLTDAYWLARYGSENATVHI